MMVRNLSFNCLFLASLILLSGCSREEKGEILLEDGKILLEKIGVGVADVDSLNWFYCDLKGLYCKRGQFSVKMYIKSGADEFSKSVYHSGFEVTTDEFPFSASIDLEADRFGIPVDQVFKKELRLNVGDWHSFSIDEKLIIYDFIDKHGERHQMWLSIYRPG